jgi:hypothetical protein
MTASDHCSSRKKTLASRGPSTHEAALLHSLRVKRSLLVLRPLYQFLDPIEQTLIGESGRQTLVMRDLAVEFDAPVTHCIPPFF